MSTNLPGGEKGLSTRHLLLIFLAGVAVCGVFFSLGFLVGYNERSGRMSPVTERVAAPATIPPTVNAPRETVPVGPGSGPPPAASVPPPLATPPTNGPASTTPKSETPAGDVMPATASPAPARADQEAEPDKAAEPPDETGGAGTGFAVQVTAVRTKQDAVAVVRILKGRGYPVVLVAPKHARGADNLYRVQVGPYASRDRAERVLAKLKHEGFKPFIRH